MELSLEHYLGLLLIKVPTGEWKQQAKRLKDEKQETSYTKLQKMRLSSVKTLQTHLRHGKSSPLIEQNVLSRLQRALDDILTIFDSKLKVPLRQL